MSDVVEQSCGECQTTNGIVKTVLDKDRNGRGVFAEKSSQLRTVEDIDEITDFTFPIISGTFAEEFMGYPFVPLIKYPGMMLIVKDKSINEIVLDMILMILSVWPLILINLLMMILAGYLVWLLVR